jgi:hypothetical protein
MDSLQATDDAAKAVQKTPNRVSLEYIKENVDEVEYLSPEILPHMTIAVITMMNGYAVVGKSAPADPENYDSELGKKFAYEDAIRQLWPLEGYLLRDRLSNQLPGTPA